MYETYKSATILDNGILTVESSGIASYTKWVSLRHVATITEYRSQNLIGRLSLNVDNGDVVHIEGEQDLIDKIIDAWGVL
jgi:hypothetical protein